MKFINSINNISYSACKLGFIGALRGIAMPVVSCAIDICYGHYYTCKAGISVLEEFRFPVRKLSSSFINFQKRLRSFLVVACYPENRKADISSSQLAIKLGTIKNLRWKYELRCFSFVNYSVKFFLRLSIVVNISYFLFYDLTDFRVCFSNFSFLFLIYVRRKFLFSPIISH